MNETIFWDQDKQGFYVASYNGRTAWIWMGPIPDKKFRFYVSEILLSFPNYAPIAFAISYEEGFSSFPAAKLAASYVLATGLPRQIKPASP